MKACCVDRTPCLCGGQICDHQVSSVVAGIFVDWPAHTRGCFAVYTSRMELVVCKPEQSSHIDAYLRMNYKQGPTALFGVHIIPSIQK